MEISVVVPVYGCPAAIQPLCERLTQTLSELTDDYEIILVNDHCPKNSWAEIKKQCNNNNKIIGLDLSKNFGQQKAILAGLDASSGNYVVVMDCDLQDKPEDIMLLYQTIKQNDYDYVLAQIKNVKLKKLTSKLFYSTYSKIMGIKIDNNISNFGIYSRIVIDSVISNRENSRGFVCYVNSLGFKQGCVQVVRENRFEGKSGYNFKKKLKSAEDIIFSQSSLPIDLLFKSGLFLGILSFFGLIISIIACVATKHFNLLGALSIIFTILICTNVIIVCLSLIGNYVYRTFVESKHKPLYYVRERIN